MKLLKLVVILLMAGQLAAQDVEQVLKAKPIAVSGSFGASMNYYDMQGMDNRRPPFYWTMNANLNFNFFGVVSAPFSLQFSPQGNQFNYPYQQLQPFNKMGISPKYKAVTLHLGYRSLNFSTYTYGGASFNGVGVEVNPAKGKFYGSALYGRIAKAPTELANNNAQGITLYNRWSVGTKLGYKIGQSNKIEFIAFKAWDDVESLILTDRLEEEPPKENAVVGLNSNFTIAKKINLKVEYALSAYTYNALSAEGAPATGVYGILDNIYQANATSKYNSAINASINYQHRLFNTGVTYKRIDPEYATMGIPFLNNDMEDVTGNLAWRMFKNKLNIALNAGAQRNNLSGDLASRTVRAIGGVNVNYAPSQKWNFSANYSNFTTNTVQMRILQLDSLKYYQVTKSGNTSAAYRFGKEKSPQNVMLSANYQNANDASDNESVLYNANLNYGFSQTATGFSVSVGMNGNVNSFQGTENIGWGPMFSVSRPFFDKQVKAGLNGNVLTFQNGSAVANRTFRAGLTLSYTLAKKHNFGLTHNFLAKQDFVGTQNFVENRTGIKYNFSF